MSKLQNIGVKATKFGTDLYSARWKIAAVLIALFAYRVWLSADRAAHVEKGIKQCEESQRTVDTGVAGVVDDGVGKAKGIDDEFDKTNDEIDADRGKTLGKLDDDDAELRAYRQGQRDARSDMSKDVPVNSCLTNPANMPSGLHDSGRSLQRDLSEGAARDSSQ